MTELPIAFTFDTPLPITLYLRPEGDSSSEWVESDQGPGRFTIPAESDVYLRARNIDDEDLYRLVKEIGGMVSLRYLNLAENRKITDLGLTRLAPLTGLTRLNLSSCSITSTGLQHLAVLKKLEVLDLSYCNRITDEGLRFLKSLKWLTYLDLQGCVKTTLAGIRKIERRGLTIHR